MNTVDSQKTRILQDLSNYLTKLKPNKKFYYLLLRILFPVVIIIGSRMYLGPITHARGRMDVTLSFAMMLLIILLIESLFAVVPRRKRLSRIIRTTLLLLMGGFFILFHLVYGLYYRFFNCSLPFDILHQWKDLFVVGGYGASLMSIPELVVAVLLPAGLLVWIIYRPVKTNAAVFIILIILITVGWIHRINRPLYRQVDSTAALPDFIHRFAYYRFKFGLENDKYADLIKNIDSRIPRNLDGYKPVKDKGITVEPIEPSSENNNPKYNIILILIESLRAYECGFTGANPSMTPELDKLAQKARVYTNFHANGTQTVRAEIGCLCSVYCNPIGVPTYLVNPNLNLISLPEILRQSGYQTVWFSGYTADFHNKRAFLKKHGIEKIYDRDVLPEPKEPTIGWGMNDHELFNNVWDILKDTNEPFFAQITTLSNHVSNSEYPTETIAPFINGSKSYTRYTKGTYYSDQMVSEFIDKILSSKLGNNTIIIATGDHGLWIFPENITDIMQKTEIYFRVPLCIWGPQDVIKSGPDNTLGSQVDIPPTILDMLKIRRTNTFLGQSLINTDITNEKRYVLSFFGTIPCFWADNTITLPNAISDEIIAEYIKAELMQDDDVKSACNFATIEGDLLHCNYTMKNLDDKDKTNLLSKRIQDITFLTIYGIYFNAYMGL